MPDPFRWPEPQWLGEITDEDERKRARIHFHLRLAALYCSQEGGLNSLAMSAGYQPGSIKAHRDRALPGHRLAKAIESAVGREHFPRELFAPDIFASE